jgi:hypothetical protein
MAFAEEFFEQNFKQPLPIYINSLKSLAGNCARVCRIFISLPRVMLLLRISARHRMAMCNFFMIIDAEVNAKVFHTERETISHVHFIEILKVKIDAADIIEEELEVFFSSRILGLKFKKIIL